MFASMSTFQANGLDVKEMARIAGEAMESWLRGFEGYRGLLMLVDDERQTARAFTFWETREAAERSAAGRAEVRDDMVERIGAELVSVEPYEIAFAADLVFD